MKCVIAYTDGACSGNPGPGGWAAVLLDLSGHSREISGNKPDTTNNEMEMTAVLKALEALKEPCKVTIFTDSKLVIGWLQDGWKCKKSHIIRLRNEIRRAMEGHIVHFEKVAGHSGNSYNDLVDALAKEAVNE